MSRLPSTPEEILQQLSQKHYAASEARLLLDYLDTGRDPSAGLPPNSRFGWDWGQLGIAVAKVCPWSEREERIVRFASIASFRNTGKGAAPDPNQIFWGVVQQLSHLSRNGAANESAAFLEIAADLGISDRAFASAVLQCLDYSGHWRPLLDDTTTAEGLPEVAKIVWNLSDEELPAILETCNSFDFDFVRALCRHRPRVARIWLDRCRLSGPLKDLAPTLAGPILAETRDCDDLVLEALAAENDPDRFSIVLEALESERPGEHEEEIRAAIDTPERVAFPLAMEWLSNHRPRHAVASMREVIAAQFHLVHYRNQGSHWFSYYQSVFRVAAERLDEGRDLFDAAFVTGPIQLVLDAIHGVRDALNDSNRDELLPILRKGLALPIPADFLAGFWRIEEPEPAKALREDLVRALSTKSKIVRSAAVETLLRHLPAESAALGEELLASPKSECRLAGVALLAAAPADFTCPLLLSRLAVETHRATRDEIHKALKAFGASIPLDLLAPPARDRAAAKPPPPPKLPKTTWLDLDALPPLIAQDRAEIPRDSVARLIERQSKHKAIEAAPDNAPLLASLDRERCAPFALALLEGFLGSGQAAADRWALALAGLLGDHHVIPPLLSRIPGL